MEVQVFSGILWSELDEIGKVHEAWCQQEQGHSDNLTSNLLELDMKWNYQKVIEEVARAWRHIGPIEKCGVFSEIND